MSIATGTEVPTKKNSDTYKPGEVRIIIPADPQKLAAYRKEQRDAKARNPNYTPPHERFNPNLPKNRRMIGKYYVYV